MSKIIFISFSLDDENQRGLLKGLSMETDEEFEFVDMNDKLPLDEEWRGELREKVKSSSGAIVLVSKATLSSEGQQLEIKILLEENKKILPMWTYTDDRTTLDGVKGFQGLKPVPWKWDDIEDFIDQRDAGSD